MFKKIISSALALCLVFGTAAVLPEGASVFGSQIEASALSIGSRGTYGDFECWAFDTGKVSIKYIGSGTAVTVPSEIDGCVVARIDDSGFEGCTTLTSITLPDSIYYIGRLAFADCTNLTTVTMANSVTSIIDGAFSGCNSLKNIKLSENVTRLGGYVFEDCKSLTSLTIPNSVNLIGPNAFKGCNNLTSITLSNSLTSIEDGMFSNCSGLKEITIPNGVTKIGYEAFEGCSGLTKINIPESVTTIDGYAFSYCSNLKDVNISKGVSSISSSAFYNCSSLSNVNIDENNSSYSSVDGVLYNKDKSVLILCPIKKTSVTIPNGVTTIGYGAFLDCVDIKEITLPNSVTGIESWGFARCTGLTSVTIPKSVTSIGDVAFGRCENLTIKCYSGSYAETYAKENNIKYELLDKPAHTHSYTTKVVAPTYTSEGYTLHTCSCGDSYKDNTKPKLTRTSLAKASVSGLKNKTYTGKAIKQTPVVKLNGKTLKSGTDYTVSYKNNKAVGTATVTVTGKGAYTGTAKATFKINPKKTTLKKLTSPKTKKLKVTYSKVSGITGYQVTYSTSSKFTKKTTKSVNASGTSKTISKLTKGKTYYVKVRTYKTVNGKKYYSGYSKVKKVKIK